MADNARTPETVTRLLQNADRVEMLADRERVEAERFRHEWSQQAALN